MDYFIKSRTREYGMLISLVVTMLFFQVMTNGCCSSLNLTTGFKTATSCDGAGMLLGSWQVILTCLFVWSAVYRCGGCVLMVEYNMHYAATTRLPGTGGADWCSSRLWCPTKFLLIVTLAGSAGFVWLWVFCKANRLVHFRLSFIAGALVDPDVSG